MTDSSKGFQYHGVYTSRPLSDKFCMLFKTLYTVKCNKNFLKLSHPDNKNITQNVTGKLFSCYNFRYM